MPGPVSVLSMCGAHAGLPELLIMMFFFVANIRGPMLAAFIVSSTLHSARYPLTDSPE